MATYGRKKKGMFSSFSVVQDDARHHQPDEPLSGGLDVVFHSLHD